MPFVETFTEQDLETIFELDTHRGLGKDDTTKPLVAVTPSSDGTLFCNLRRGTVYDRQPASPEATSFSWHNAKVVREPSLVEVSGSSSNAHILSTQQQQSRRANERSTGPARIMPSSQPESLDVAYEGGVICGTPTNHSIEVTNIEVTRSVTPGDDPECGFCSSSTVVTNSSQTSASTSSTSDPRENEVGEGFPSTTLWNGKTLPPLRPLSAYNFFFRDERDRILHKIVTGEERSRDEVTPRSRRKWLLWDHWGRDRSKRRPHRKVHGMISFRELTIHIADAWKQLTEDDRNFYRDVAEQDKKRFENEMQGRSKRKRG